MAIVKKRKKKSKIYFGTPVHNAIVKYNESEDVKFRNKIYTEEIHTAFLKLAENNKGKSINIGVALDKNKKK